MCPDCDVTLVTERPDGELTPEMALVSVFRATDPGVLPLASMALDEAGIDYVVARGQISGVIVGQRSDISSASPVEESAIEILVAAENEARARDLLVDLEEAQDTTPQPDDGKP